MSYIEIYNENIRDLLNPGAGPLELRDEGGNGAPVVAGLSEVPILTRFCLTDRINILMFICSTRSVDELRYG